MSSPRQVILSLDAPQPLSVYSQAIQSGSLLFLAGQIPIDPVSGELVSSTIALETDRIMANLSAVLSAAGSSLQSVVKTTVYLTNMGDFAEFNAAYAKYFPSAPPARTTVAVAALPRGVRIEIEAIAAIP